MPKPEDERFAETVKRMLQTPHKAHRPMKKSSKKISEAEEGVFIDLIRLEAGNCASICRSWRAAWLRAY
jgi:hypothetical protein